jgi:indolepyruvate ferredoxin oxidoreductase
MIRTDVTLDDKYALESGQVYVTGTQALVRLLLEQRRRDLAAGLNTAGYVSGYRGSPLANVDREMWRAGEFLERHHIRFQPGVNEDLAATAIWGTQQVGFFPGAKYDGVFAMWYGKGPGVDRTGDVFRHANLAGTAARGGVLALAGDDPACKSSTLASQCEFTFMDVEIPVLHPANIQEFVDYGLYGWAMSRYSGCWVAMKTVTENVDCSASISVGPERVDIRLPEEFVLPREGVHIRPGEWPPLVQEMRLKKVKIYAALAFARANRLDRAVIDGANRRFGIVTVGKSYLDVLQALDDLGIDERHARDIGLSVYKVGLVWPLEREGIRRFAEGLDEILVVEEKRAVIENQLKEQLYNWREEARPRVIGEFDENGEWILPSAGELTPARIARVIARRLERFYVSPQIRDRLAFLASKERALEATVPSIRRVPYFCAGCPHNTSTRVPEGSHAVAGIGCHYMATWMDRATETYTHMGGEGVNWIGMAPFTEMPHIFVNLGDGTYYHSGLLAIRAAVAAGTRMTYKILYNDAVAMTGGQPIDGPLDVPMVARQVAAEGVKRIAVVSDEPGKYGAAAGFPAAVSIHHRDDLDAVQRDLRQVEGPSVLIYDQTCAAEKRRRRKRGKYPDPPQRAFINEWVCEGCGDCGVQSNCVAIVPADTAFGRKRQIDQSSCNKDFSCLKGFCPSFVSVHGGQLSKPMAPAAPAASDLPPLPEPRLPAVDQPYGIVIAGIGGTGVVTIGALIGMAAHLEGKGVAVLDQIGLAQKNGAVVSHVRVAARPEDIHAVRISAGEARLLLGCDIVTSGSAEVLGKLRAGHSRAVINSHATMTADFTRNPDQPFPVGELRAAITESSGEEAAWFADCTRLATRLAGDSIATNPFILGVAYQQGLVPVSAEALERAIELNGAAVDFNKQAFWWGRRAAFDLDAVRRIADGETGEEAVADDLDDLVRVRVAELTAYQSARYARRYAALVERVRTVERERAPGSTGFAEAVARSYFKLLAYKDEYEVARLYADGRFEESLRRQFDGPYTLTFHLAPPLFAKRDPVTGHLRKREYGPWVMAAFRRLARLKGLRGTPLDVFGYTAERREERRLIRDYQATVGELIAGLDRENHRLAGEIAGLPLRIRGFGHVKEKSIGEFRARQKVLIQAFHHPLPAVEAAE